MHAHALALHLRRAMLAALAAPAVVACGGVIDPGGDGGPGGECVATAIEAGAGSCGSKSIQLSGDVSKCGVTYDDAGNIPEATCTSLCGGSQYALCTLDSSSDILSCESFCTGRLPACLRGVLPDASGATNAVGEYLARAAYLESAAVGAFAILAAELRALGAPRSLVRSAERAGADEVRHAREVGDLARAFGTEPEAPVVARAGVRPLVDIALENAVEGCVRETFGALLATWQSERAGDARVRATMKRIARDETRHAALGWRIFDWAEAALAPRDRARVRASMLHAASELASAVTEPDPAAAATLGLPSAAETRALAAAMRADLWRPSATAEAA